LGNPIKRIRGGAGSVSPQAGCRLVVIMGWREMFSLMHGNGSCFRLVFASPVHSISARPRLLGVPCECSEPSPFPSRPLPALPRRNAVRLADRNGRSLAPQHPMPAGSARRISEPRATDRERGSAPLEAQSLTVSSAGLFRILLPGTRPRLDLGPVHLLGRHLGRLLQISPWTCLAVGDGRQCLSLKGCGDHANAQHRGLACVGEGGGSFRESHAFRSLLAWFIHGHPKHCPRRLPKREASGIRTMSFDEPRASCEESCGLQAGTCRGE